MGRAGRSSGGGGGRSGGSFSSGSRSGRSHRISSPRAGSGYSGSSTHHGYGGFSSRRVYSYSGPRTSHVIMNNPAGNVYVESNKPPKMGNFFLRFLGYLLVSVLIISVVLLVANNKHSNTIERTKVASGLSYDSNVVLSDELNWIESKQELSRALKGFWDETGVQPYIMLLDYNPELQTDEQKESYTHSLYDKYITREDAFLFVYYGEQNEDDVGLMCTSLGKLTTEVLDDYALDAFFKYVDMYWYQDISTVDVFDYTYNKTAKYIMHKSPVDGILSIVLVVVIIGLALIAIYKFIEQKRRHEKEKAKETESILNAAMNDLVDNKSDSLRDKYL